ncbi:MAG: HD domain-containing phosphohydrolase [Burkholderiaceae bacterium]
MKAATPATRDLIDVDALRVGMFVHLDLGWMSHPFPLSSFRISNAEQVATIRALGLRRVRWSPQQSELTLAPEPSRRSVFGDLGPAAPITPPELRRPGAEAASGAATAWATPPAPVGAADPGAGVDVAAAALAALAGAASGSAPSQASAPMPLEAGPSSAAPTLSIEAAAQREHRRALARQDVALQLCERQFAEATYECKRLTDRVVKEPREARREAEALAGALVAKMLGEQELCIRLLSGAAGDKSGMHALNVTVIALLMGRCFGLAESELEDLGVGAMLHDIGKIELPERVRHREDDFGPAEHRAYEDHVAQGVVFARKMSLSAGATLVIAQHHENADGSGFPLRLNTDRMTAAARVVALVNRYDNLCNPHLPSKALTPHEALSHMFAQGKTKFDTAILGAFIKMMGVYPPGSTVQLTDDRFALVVGVNSTRPLKPRVMVHERGVPRDEALLLDLEAAPGLGIRRSIKPLQLPPAAFDYLAPRPRVVYFFEPAQAAKLAA